MGKVYKRGKIWYYDTIAGKKRIRKRVGTSKKLAEIALIDIEAKIIRNELDLDYQEIEIIDLFDKFLDYSKLHHSYSTYKRYKNVFENFWIFIDFLIADDVQFVSELKPKHLEEYKKYRLNTDPRTIILPIDYPLIIRKNRLPAKTTTLNFELKTIKSIFNWGIKQELCRINPVQNVQMLKVIDSKMPRFLTIQECQLFLNACNDEQYPIIFTFLNTGLRLGELLNLQWSDIDLKRKQLKIQKKDFWQPKSGERIIPLNNEMIDLMKKRKFDYVKQSDFVFPHKDGGPLKRKLRQDVINIAKSAGLESMTKVHS